ncbi:aminoacyl-tRNA hydrolase [Allobaculum stercoricanis]|uniref:aminoacyl-tRNA hydrolase n=1 Tax=Allobaculum stercoricanis TaxID=174709 RepID=UPI003C6C7400
MKLIVGLGNPGVKYEGTRHNAGFMVMDAISEKLNVSINKKKFEGSYVKTKIGNEDVILLKPETYMNNSGFSVRACMDFFKISREDILVIYDDLDTPVGSIRLKTKGSAGGHNGVKSVIACAMGEEFDRIRVGIGRNPQINIIDYVLTRFRPDELEDLNHSVEQAANAAILAIKQGFPKAMNRYNVKPKKPKVKKEEKENTKDLYPNNGKDEIYRVEENKNTNE